MNDLYNKLTGDLVYDDSTIANFITIVVIAIVFSFLILLMLLDKRKTLLIRVELYTPKEFRDFEPENYLYHLSSTEFRKIEKKLHPKGKKKAIRIIYKRSTPSGNRTYSGSTKYNLAFIKEYVEKMNLIFSDGKTRINGLNALYELQLSKQEEVNDGIPKIYCYRLPNESSHRGILKVGYTKGSVFKRVQDQLKTAAKLKVEYEILLIMPAQTISESTFMDHTVHKALKNNGIINTEGEWFKCDLETVKKAIKDVQMNKV